MRALFVVMLLIGRALSFRPARPAAWSRRASTTALDDASGPGPLFRFGVCADVQYVNADDDYNFQKTKVRRYRQSLEIFREAVEHWDSQGDVAFALVLGDILDGKSSALKTQGRCLDEVLEICQRWGGGKYWWVSGNHCHYAFSRPELHSRLYQQIAGTSESKLYYDFCPHPSWRFISLDAYDVSLIGASSEANRLQAAALLAKHNPNNLETSGTWFDNLPRDLYRYVPYNGGIGEAQLAWFKDTLEDAKSKEQRCIVFCHQPALAPDKPQSVLWNSEVVRGEMEKSGNVALWIAGHDHDGQFNYCKDSGTYHLVPPAPIECAVGEKAYGTIEVFADRLQLSWTGREPSRPTMLPWRGTREMLLAATAASK